MAPSGRPRGRPRGSGRGRAGASSTRGGTRSQTAAVSGNENSAAATEPSDAPDASGADASTPAVTTAPIAPIVPTRGQGSSTRAGRGGGSSAAGGSVATGGSKFKPRAVRRADAERERIAQEEIRKQNIKVAEDQRLQRARLGRGGGRGGRARGRGDAMGRGGVFGTRKASDSVFFGNPGSLNSGFGRFGSESNFKVGGYRDASNRLNADMFNGPMMDFDDNDRPEEKEVTPGASSSTQAPTTGAATAPGRPPPSFWRKRDIMPMGIPRREPKKPEVVVATAADMQAKEKAAAGGVREDSDSSLSTPVASDVVLKDDGRVWPGAPVDRKVKVKGEDGTEIEVTEIDDMRLQQALKLQQQRADADGASAVLAAGEGEDQEEQRKKKKYATREEEITAEKMALMLGELGPRPPEADSRDGRMYLFQFPPVMPPLRVVSRPKKQARDPVKKEPAGDDDEDLVTMGFGETTDLTGRKDEDSGEEREEGGGVDDDDDRSKPYPDVVGYVGKMVVRRSGKTTIDWGGIPFQVMPGIETSFLTNAVLLEETDSKRVKPGEVAGKAYGMGKVMGRFVCRPIWREAKPWVVDPRELVADK